MLPDHGWERLELNYRIVSGSAMGPVLHPEVQVCMSSDGSQVWVAELLMDNS